MHYKNFLHCNLNPKNSLIIILSDFKSKNIEFWCFVSKFEPHFVRMVGTTSKKGNSQRKVSNKFLKCDLAV